MTDDLTTPRIFGAHFAHLLEGGGVRPVAVDADFWSKRVAELPPGRLVSLFELSADWTSWEMHPEDDELIMMLTGRASLILEDAGAATTQPLEAGAFSIAPKGVWHTMDVLEKGRALFITAGAGTQHRPR